MRALLPGAVAIVVTVALAACAATPTLAPGVVPITLGQNGRPSDSTRDYTDSIGPGVPFAWGVRIGNAAEQDIVIDSFELVGRSAGLDVLGAGLLPTVPPPAVGVPTAATADVQSAVAALPLAAARFGPPGSAGWRDGGEVAFILRVTAAGDYSVAGVRLHYHVGLLSFDTTLNAALELCVGATVDASAACPLASPAPTK